MKERDVSLENDLMMLGQEPMDEPNSSTTIELQRVVKETERKMLKPPAPPMEAEKKNVPKPVEPKNDPTVKTEPKAKTETVSTKEPKTYKPTISRKLKTRQIRADPHQPLCSRRVRLQRQLASTRGRNRHHRRSRGGNRPTGRGQNILAVHHRRSISRFRHAPTLRLV